MTDKELNIKAIDVLRTALGTMVIRPIFKTDPSDITNKLLVSNFQYPIIEGEARKEAEDKLRELINSL